MQNVDDGELMWVVDNPEEAERQMKENNGKFSGMLRPVIKNPEVFKLIVIPESEGAVGIWQDVLNNIKKEKINVRKDVYDKTGKWKKSSIKWFAAIYNEKTGDAPVMSLLSQTSEKSNLWINLITSNSPLQPRPYTTMLQNALKQFASEKLNVKLIIPKEYKVSEEAPIVVENEEGVILKGDEADKLLVRTDQSNEGTDKGKEEDV